MAKRKSAPKSIKNTTNSVAPIRAEYDKLLKKKGKKK